MKHRKKNKKITSQTENKEEELKEWKSENKNGFNTPFFTIKDLLESKK